MDLKGKCVLVTGASSGIGWETALAFAERGSKVAVSARRAEKLAELGAKIRALGAEALELPCDVAKLEDVKAMVRRMVEAWGGVDVLVNNAGTNEYSLFMKLPVEHSDAIVRTNLLGPIYVLSEVLPLMDRRGGGHVVNVASIAGLRGMPFMAAYSASKAGLVGLTESLRVELRQRNVTLTAFCPGTVDTPMMDKAHLSQKKSLLLRPKTPRQAAQKIVLCAEKRLPEYVYGEAPGFVLKLVKLAPGAADAFVYHAYKRLKNMFPEALRL